MQGDAGGETKIAEKTALSGHKQHEPSKLKLHASTFLWRARISASQDNEDVGSETVFGQSLRDSRLCGSPRGADWGCFFFRIPFVNICSIPIWS